MSLLSACPGLGLISLRHPVRFRQPSHRQFQHVDFTTRPERGGHGSTASGLLPALSAFVLLFLAVRHPHCSGAFLCCGWAGPSLIAGPGSPAAAPWCRAWALGGGHQ